MRKFFYGLGLLVVVCFCCGQAAAAATTQRTPAPADNDFYGAVSRLLQQHVRNGKVDYAKLQQHQAQLQELVHRIASYSLQGTSAAGRKAFYINAYNLLVMQQILGHYPVQSVRDIPGFFDKQKYKVAGEQLTLDQLEKNRLDSGADPRLHFALVCGAVSCPPLRNEAYTPDQVDKQLTAQAQEALNSNEFVQVTPQNRKALVSEIFKWYKSDFLRQAPSVQVYVNRYRTNKIPTSYNWGYYTYDWMLNDLD